MQNITIFCGKKACAFSGINVANRNRAMLIYEFDARYAVEVFPLRHLC